MLGVLSPSLPLWQGCTAARRTAWLREKDALAQEVSVPVGSDPPPAPNCGWVLVRESAFPDGIPACTSQRDAWKLALTAQKNGAYAAAFEPLTRSAARADILNEYETAAAQPAAVAKQLGAARQAQTAKVKGETTHQKARLFILILSVPQR